MLDDPPRIKLSVIRASGMGVAQQIIKSVRIKLAGNNLDKMFRYCAIDCFVGVLIKKLAQYLREFWVTVAEHH